MSGTIQKHSFSITLSHSIMDTNNNGDFSKRPKRPRIGSAGNGNASSSSYDSRFEKVSYGTNRDSDSDGERPARPYQPRPRYNRNDNNNDGQGGYQPRPRYNRNNDNDGQGGYQPRPRYNRNNDNDGQGGYQPRPRYNRNDNNNDGYQPRPRYNRNNDNDGQGGYQPRPRYNRNNDNDGQGGYQPRPRYNRNNDGNNRQGGYNRYNNRNNNGRGPQRPGKSFTPRPKRIEYEEPEIDPNAEIRLNKFIANAGICSRREADEHITNGEIKVNGNVVTELGTKITAKDVVEFNGKVVTTERKCYVLLNKPKDCVTTSDDPNGRMTVMDLVKNACEERIYPVGRLDRNTTGVLLLTNDGDLASKLTHPQYVKKKIYHVWTDHDISEDDMQRIADGIELEDGPIHADAISYATETDRNQAGIEIHSGRNRIVRRIFESLGYHVTKLDRVYFAGLTKKNLPRGRWRYLTQEEVNFLKMGSFE